MISKKQKNAILTGLGSHAVKQAQTHASKMNITKEDGKEYSRSAFSEVLHGRLHHPEIEKVWWATLQQALDLKEAELSKTNELVQRVSKIA